MALQKEFIKHESWMFTFFPDLVQDDQALAAMLDHFSIETVESQELRRYVVGNEVAPTTGTPHKHVVLHWKPEGARSFTEMKLLLGRSLPVPETSPQPWGGLKYNKNPHAFFKYAKKDGDYIEWDIRKTRRDNKRPNRDTVAEAVIEMCRMEGCTMRSIEQEYPVFTFWHHNNVVQCLSRHRAYANNDDDGGVYQLNPNFNI